jgi:hypothetical protein
LPGAALSAAREKQKNEALRTKLRCEVNLPTYRAVAQELAAAHDQLAREHKSLTSEAAMPELPGPSLAWAELSALIGVRWRSPPVDIDEIFRLACADRP